jgi:hypothetical protein
MVALYPITGEVQVFVGGKVSLLASFMVSVGGSDHGWPREFNAKITFDRIARQFISLGIYDAELDSRQR